LQTIHCREAGRKVCSTLATYHESADEENLASTACGLLLELQSEEPENKLINMLADLQHRYNEGNGRSLSSRDNRNGQEPRGRRPTLKFRANLNTKQATSYPPKYDPAPFCIPFNPDPTPLYSTLASPDLSNSKPPKNIARVFNIPQLVKHIGLKNIPAKDDTNESSVYLKEENESFNGALPNVLRPLVLFF